MERLQSRERLVVLTVSWAIERDKLALPQDPANFNGLSVTTGPCV